MPALHRITIYPIKSLDGVEVSTVNVLPSGALAGDRRYALVDCDGGFVNRKRYAAIHLIRAKYSDDFERVTLSSPDAENCFSLRNEQDAIANWCGNILGVACQLVEGAGNGFPDDRDAPGPTLISTSTLAKIATWFDELEVDEVRRRFRANLEIDAKPEFWEDQLVGDPNENKRFCVGNTTWQGRGICQRCVVPSRDTHDGALIAGFAREFSRRRQTSLPEWSPIRHFDHFYRAAINTALESLDNGNVVRVGDSVELIEKQCLDR